MTAPSSKAKRVLVVDDDATTRLLVSHHLNRNGYESVVASDVPQARKILQEQGADKFDCIITDYLMPGGTGLELLQWVKQLSPPLAAIMATAVGERGLVQESLRGGACDFLDKPIENKALLKSVRLAIETTHRQRQLKETESSVWEVGRFQEFMLGMNPASLPTPVEICWHPKHPVGGDLVNVFQLNPKTLLLLIADVSGHDLKAGYISAFFQGIVRGLVEKGTPVQEVLEYFNRLLLREWSGAQALEAPRAQAHLAASISTCAFVIDLEAQQLSVWNAGFPLPIYIDGHGESRLCGDTPGFPLGWFEHSAPHAATVNIAAGGYLYAWTDGLEDYAASVQVHPLSLADQLLQARRSGEKPAWLQDCADDVLLIRLQFSLETKAPAARPLIFQQYFAGQQQQVDELQSGWEKSLELALPGLPEGKLFDLLLCSREAVINAIKYGCAQEPAKPCTFQVNLEPDQRRLRVVVTDPGTGHHFDWAKHAANNQNELVDEHRGLMLIHQLPDHTRVERNGAALTMEFNVAPPPAPKRP